MWRHRDLSKYVRTAPRDALNAAIIESNQEPFRCKKSGGVSLYPCKIARHSFGVRVDICGLAIQIYFGSVVDMGVYVCCAAAYADLIFVPKSCVGAVACCAMRIFVCATDVLLEY